ncbi:MAG TPA: alpha-L-arabinofuranosidase C-terminal domain-containing protein [Pseudonocardiaceae bacterium]|jgi:alpha-L-arabinofuranosidase|nr:alpha-L-arabinofuranosidase C-terminal domain-containing protein [Pseudonocardiaceae bacterium]
MRRRARLIALLVATVAISVPPSFGNVADAAGTGYDAATSFEIIDVSSGNALSAAGTGTGLDPAMTITALTGAEDQLWHLADLGAGWSRIVNDHTGTSLSTVNGGSGNGAVVHLWDYLSTYPDQHWALRQQADGTAQIVNQGTGNRLLSTQDGDGAAGSPVQLWDSVAGRAGQNWRIVPTTSTISVDAGSRTNHIPTATSATGLEDVNHEIYGGIYSQMIFGEAFQEPPDAQGVSDMWSADLTGSARGSFAPDTTAPDKGDRSQQITDTGGTGSAGVANRGLNREGLDVVGGKDYDGMVTLRAPALQRVRLSFQSADGATTYAATTLTVDSDTWQTYHFTLTTNATATDTHAQFAIQLLAPGTIDAGYAFVEPGTWGRYDNLPVRKDVADALEAEGVTALRYGGSVINAPSYQWKTMIGPPQDRPVTTGTWYPYESNGFGIFDFLNLAQALGVQAVPTLNVNETPQDISDFMDYLMAPTTNPWGARRAADGHPAPYTIDRIELGNEEAVNDAYWQKFQVLAPIIWHKDPAMRIVVGDFSYADVITDPFNFTGAPLITSLAAHQKILALAKAQHAEVDFDVHIWTEQTPDVLQEVKALDSYDYWLGQLSDGATFKVVIFELNADSHDVGRALANAYAVNQLARRGDNVDVVSSANALQVDGQNDNGWDQGLIFFNQSAVWQQPPYYVEQMNAQNYQPWAVATTVSGGESYTADATGAVSSDSRQLTLHVVNTLPVPRQYTVDLTGLRRSSDTVAVTTLSGQPSAANTFADPSYVTPTSSVLHSSGPRSTVTVTVAPNSYTTFDFQ